VINHRVFQLDGLTWQWGLVIGQVVIYFVAAELYKLAKRKFYYRRERMTKAGIMNELEKRGGQEFRLAYTMEV
jgi:hypothetical protein